MILREGKCEEKAEGSSEKVRRRTLKRSPKVKELTVKKTPRKRQFQCPICDKFLSSAANLRRASILKSLFCACQLSKLGVKFINLFIMHKVAHQDLTLILYYRKFNAVL